MPRVPVVGRLGVQRVGPRGRRRVRYERLEERGADIRMAAAARHGPDVIEEHAVSPWTFLLQRDGGGAQAPLARAERAVASGRKQEDRTGAPDDSARGRLRRREEETLGDVA